MKKRCYLFLLNIFFILLIVINLIEIISGLGISPAIIEDDFKPGLERTFEYSVFGGNPNFELEVYAAGELAEYVKLDKDTLSAGGGKFLVTIKLPEYIEKPGKNRIYIGAREKFDEELAGGTVGTSVTIQAVIVIYVPYPGKYLEISLKSNNVNVGEPVNFELNIISRGDEDVNMTPQIEITSSNKTIENLYFRNRELKSQESITLKKALDTTNYNPGTYNAIAIVDYGKIASAESSFKIGDLFINIVNYTRQIFIGEIKRFDIEIESGWNDNIDGVYAEVFIFNGSERFIDFKTSSTSLTPWERKTITGFFDTSNFLEGFYDANITLIYYGKDIGKTSTELVEIEFIKEAKKITMWLIIAGILLVLIIIGFIIKKYLFKKWKKVK